MQNVNLVLFVLLFSGIYCQSPFDADDVRNNELPQEIEDGSVEKCDILFVLDASSSITVERFDAMRNFVKEVLDTDIDKLGRDQIQVGLVVFSNDVAINIPFNKYYKTKQLQDAIANLTYARGESNLGKALKFARKVALQPANGYRPTVPHVIIILTDGWLTDGPLASKELKRLKKKAVHSLVVGIGEHLDKGGLKGLAKLPDIVHLEKWTGLSAKVPELKKKIQDHKKRLKRCEQNFKANVIFIVDSSSSIGRKNFKELKDFLINVVGAFKVIGKNGVQVGLVQYSSFSRTKVVFNLDTYNNHKGMIQAIRRMRYSRGSTKTGYAMRMAGRWLIPKARKGIHNNFIVVTDGKATDHVEVGANDLHSKNFTVMSVGVGKEIDDDELRLIASEPKEMHVFHPDDFGELQHYLKYVVAEVCRPIEVASKQQVAEKAAEEAKDAP